MSMWAHVVRVFRRRDIDRDIDEELQTHLDEALTEGRDAAESARALGSRLRTREAVHDVLVAAWLESLIADMIFGWRQLRKH
jgi:hypothetical protein